jgi:hypothetical protein
MEPALRGILEKIIDEELSDDRLVGNFRIFTQIRNAGLVDSVPSAIFGRIYTRAYNAWLEYKARDDKPLNRHEATEFSRIFETRAMEIRSRLTEISSL